MRKGAGSYVDKTVVVTGGSGGLGRAVAFALSGKYRVHILARNERKLRAVADVCGCTWHVCDVTDATQVQTVFDRISESGDPIDVVINNAGVIAGGELADTPYRDIEKVIATNTLGALYVAKAATQLMKRQRGGLLLNVVSQSGLTVRAGRSVYQASKWAITGMTKALQKEMIPYGVKVTGFYPGAIDTALLADAGENDHGPAISAEDAADAICYVLSVGDHILIPELGIKHYLRTV